MKLIKLKRGWKWHVGLYVIITLICSIIYSLVKVCITPDVIPNAPIGTHVRSDYMLMLLQCVLGIVVMGLPSLLKKHLSLELPNSMCIVYFIFLYCAIYLGEVRNFYELIPHWDTILHGFSGMMLGALGFTLIRILNDSERINVVLSPIFICLFAFCFALAAGVVWEIYEYTADSLFGLNMQRYRLMDGTLKIGQEALEDTMSDLIVDSIGALIVVIIGFVTMKGKEFYHKKKDKTNETIVDKK